MTAVRRLSVQREPELWKAGGEHAADPGRVRRRRARPALAQGRVAQPWRQREGPRRRAPFCATGSSAGELPGKRLLDASSGNTGIAYAMLGAAAGVRVTICLPGNASPERKALLEIYGAEVIVTDRMEGTEGAARRAQELAESEPDRVLLRRPVQQSGQSPGPPGDHGPGGLGPDRRAA